MNRPIKFRALRDGTWYILDLANGMRWESALIRAMRDETLVFDSPLCQYTGLKDEAGQDIYEGDIITYWSSFKSGNVPVKLRKYELVLYDDCSRCGFKPFCDNWDYDGMSFCDTYPHFEVAGNIYEHSHLLETQS